MDILSLDIEKEKFSPFILDLNFLVNQLYQYQHHDMSTSNDSKKGHMQIKHQKRMRFNELTCSIFLHQS